MPEIDFILEMGAKDDPDRFTFMRGGKDPRRDAAESAAAWVATATTPEQKLRMAGLSEQQKRLNAYRARGSANGGMKPGMTRAGKPLNG